MIESNVSEFFNYTESVLKTFLIFLSTLLLFQSSLSAQKLKGSWTKKLVCGQCLPENIAFADTNSGFIITTGGDYNTHNGGITIQQYNGDFFLEYNLPDFRCAYAPSPDTFIVVDDGSPQDRYPLSIDGGTTWQ